MSFALGMFVLEAVGSPFGVGHPVSGISALVAIPIVVPAAFVAGTLVWRLLPETVPLFGAVAGAVAAVGTYPGSLAIAFVLLVFHQVVVGAGIEGSLVGAGGRVAIVGTFAFMLAAWLTIPIGCVSGAIYERARPVS